MISRAVFGRYARALADIALESAQEPQVSADLAVCRELFGSVPDLAVAFDSPAVPRDAKRTILDEIVRLHPVGETVRNFLRVLLDHNRIGCFQEIADAYAGVVRERQGVVAASVRTATPLPEGDLSRLRESLAKATGKMVTLEVRTDASLLGGIVVQLGSTVYDGSIRKHLDQMRQRLQEV